MKLSPPEWGAILDSLYATAERFPDAAHRSAIMKVEEFVAAQCAPEAGLAKVFKREDVDLPQHPLRSAFVVVLCGLYVVHESWTCASAQMHAQGINAEIAKAVAEGRA